MNNHKKTSQRFTFECISSYLLFLASQTFARESRLQGGSRAEDMKQTYGKYTDVTVVNITVR